MKCAFEMTNEEVAIVAARYKKLQTAISNAQKPLLEFTKRSGYAHYKFEGVYRAELITALGGTPTPEDLIMLVDNGFSHFGAACSVDHGTRRFWGHVNID